MQSGLKKLLNSNLRMAKVLKQVYGIVPRSSAFPCPFPEHGSVDVHPSAKFFEDANEVYCFAEQRVYTVYDVLIGAGQTDAQLTSFVLNELGGKHLQPGHQQGDDQLMMKLEGLVSTYMEGSLARFKRGELSWIEVLPVIQGYFDNVNTMIGGGE